MSALPLESELSKASALNSSMISVEESAAAQLLPFFACIPLTGQRCGKCSGSVPSTLPPVEGWNLLNKAATGRLPPQRESPPGVASGSFRVDGSAVLRGGSWRRRRGPPAGHIPGGDRWQRGALPDPAVCMRHSWRRRPQFLHILKHHALLEHCFILYPGPLIKTQVRRTGDWGVLTIIDLQPWILRLHLKHDLHSRLQFQHKSSASS